MRLMSFFARNSRRTSVRFVAVILGVVGIAIGIGKGLSEGGDWGSSISEFFLNIGNDLFGIAVTVLVIDLLNEKNEEIYQKEKLIRELSSKDNGTAIRALVDLEARGWLKDGTLTNAILIEANLIGISLSKANLAHVSLERAIMTEASLSNTDLRNANLIDVNIQNGFLQEIEFENANLWKSNLSSSIFEKVNFRNATLWQANFQGSFLNECSFASADMRSVNLKDATINDIECLKQASRLCGAIMPDGQKYNGSYNLNGDFEDAKKRDLDINDPKAMSLFFGVSLDEYATGRNPDKS